MPVKKQSEPSGRSNKIRFVLVEADISDGNLSEITQAITNALKPTMGPARQIARTTPHILPPTRDGGGEPHEEQAEETEELEIVQPEDDDSTLAKTPRAKKFKPPDYLPDLFAGEKSRAFKEFAVEKAPSTKNKKYLVATYWLKEYGGNPTVNANKIYTSFKTAGWSTGFNDWGQPFHNLVHSEHLRKEGLGEFAINPLGEDAVTKGTD